MGDWDFYCALCASSFNDQARPSSSTASTQLDNILKLGPKNPPPSPERESPAALKPFNGVDYRGRLAWRERYFEKRTLEWHARLHALWFETDADADADADAESEPRVREGRGRVSGAGWYDSYGIISVPESVDQVVLRGQEVTEELRDFHAYRHIDEIGECGIPMHGRCAFGVLSKAVGFVTGAEGWREWVGLEGKVELALLFTVLHRMDAGVLPDKVDYGERQPAWDQFHVLGETDMCSVADPVEIPLLGEYYKGLPVLAIGETGNSVLIGPAAQTSGRDCFAQLSMELILAIADSLSIKDVLALRAVSRAASLALLHPSFWRIRIHRDMPWLWDAPGVEASIARKGSGSADPGAQLVVDWRQMYEDLYRSSFEQPKLGEEENNDRGCIPGLWNRRRIWRACVQIAERYAQECEESKKTDCWGHWRPHCLQDQDSFSSCRNGA